MLARLWLMPRRKERRVICNLNSLLHTFDLPVVENLNEISPSLLVALYESIKGRRLNTTRRCKSSPISKLQSLLASLSNDLPGLNFSAFKAELICAQDSEQLLKFIDVLISLGRLLCITRDIDMDETGQSSILSSLILLEEDSGPNESSCVSLETTCKLSSGTIAQKNSSQSTSSELLHLFSPTEIRKTFASAPTSKVRARARRAARKRARLSTIGVTNIRQTICKSKQERQAPLSSRRCEKHLGLESDVSQTTTRPATIHPIAKSPSTLCRAKTCGPAATTQDTVLSFLSDSSVPSNGKPVCVDSPYTNYLKARRKMVLAGMGHKCSPLRMTPPVRISLPKSPFRNNLTRSGYSWQNRNGQLQGQPAKTPSRGKSIKDSRVEPLHDFQTRRLFMTSIASSKDSNQSFYGEPDLNV